MNIYVLYRGDEVVGVGTRKELAERFGVTEKTITGYGCPAYLRRVEDKDGVTRAVRVDV